MRGCKRDAGKCDTKAANAAMLSLFRTGSLDVVVMANPLACALSYRVGSCGIQLRQQVLVKAPAGLHRFACR